MPAPLSFAELKRAVADGSIDTVVACDGVQLLNGTRDVARFF